MVLLLVKAATDGNTQKCSVQKAKSNNCPAFGDIRRKQYKLSLHEQH